MKFGKKIQHAAAVSTSLCKEDCWMSYKALKKLLKPFEQGCARVDTESKAGEVVVKQPAPPETEGTGSEQTQQGQQGQQGKPELAAIAQNQDERRFFAFLKKELHKVIRVYAELERRALADFVELLIAVDNMKEVELSEDLNLRVLTRFVEIHRRLVLLRNFAVLNYVGFTKILKKHDKLTGYQTRDKYMLKIVNDQSFAQHLMLKRSLDFMQEEYQTIKLTGRLRRSARTQALVVELQKCLRTSARQQLAAPGGRSSKALSSASTKPLGCFPQPLPKRPTPKRRMSAGSSSTAAASPQDAGQGSSAPCKKARVFTDAHPLASLVTAVEMHRQQQRLTP